MKKLLRFFGILAALGSFVAAYTGDDDYGHHMGGMMGENFGYGMMFFGWVFWILVIVVLVLLIAWLIKQLQKK